jgi:chaperonin cofactor prefoldin
MDSLHDQVSELNIKVDALHQMIEQFGYQTTEMLLTLKQLGEGRNSGFQPEAPNRPTYQSYHRSVLDTDMDHKDILSDFSYTDLESQSGDRNLSLEVQVQRLTAQLTAAYNRIAALEEQLIAKRIH